MPTPALEHVADAQAAVDAADLALHTIVTEAREAGTTWRHVGEAVGISPELARQRWNGGHQLAWRAKRPRSGRLTVVPPPPIGDLPVLQRMVNAYIALDQAHAAVPGTVAAARAYGESWRNIGQALGGISKQAAYERYGRNPDLPPRVH